MTIQALLFDLDGTLTDSKPAAERVWKNWGQRHGIPWEKIAPVLHGRRAIDTMRLLAPNLPQPEEAERLTDEEVRDTEGVIAIPGAADFLKDLKRNRWAIVTSCPRRLALARLRAAGLPLPDILIAAEDVTHGKPAPDGYLFAAQKIGVPPAACLVIEDAPAGFEAAQRARMHLLVVDAKGDAAHGRSGISHYNQLEQALASLQLTIEARLLR